jgi:ABC-type transport system substrate-binding protein
VFNGFGTPACSALTKVMFGYDPASCDYLPFDVEAAAAELDAAGWVLNQATGFREREGQPLVIQHYYRADSPLGVSMATYLKADLAKVGIDVQLNGLSGSGYFDAVRTGQHNTQNWWDTWTDPDGLRVLFSSANADGGTNRNRYRSEAMDALLATAAATSDPVARAEAIAAVQKQAADDAVMIFMVDPTLLYGHSAQLSNVRYLGGGNLPSFYAASLAE